MSKIKKYITNLFDPQLLIIVLVAIAVCIILTMIFSQKAKEFKQRYRSKFYIYLFSVAFIYAIIALLGYNRLFQGNNLYEFFFYQMCSLIIGIIHCYVYRGYFDKFELRKPGNEYLFAVVSVFYASVPFMLIYSFLNGTDLVYLMLGHFIVFFIPTFLNDTFNRAMNIPPKVYVTWQFPENYKETVGLSDDEWRDMVVFTYVMDKDKNARKYSVYRAKGPTRLDFGRLFYNFVVDYNQRHPEDQIQVEDENGLFSWVFFLQPKWYESTKYIDPNLTLYMNGIEENSVVFCMRTDQVLGKNKPTRKADFEYSQEKETQYQ
ncbi:TssN family type VI secretion system protein [Chryseobacterium salviniae]|uniref:TssN family type VI secretion system protein n=1 Tax=Chryseobacterium salviniae TaxID=3101750 RepID=A0ABU6HN91_9FLAO|nr:TssN family type VI secretion system protein [Chryseobacterium sp. T9W2-O]MEC3874184.1 TssN family type VI secretion system protein [Chryseobacterium sp. T9W2-O]